MRTVRIGEIATITRGVSYKKEQAVKSKLSGYTALLRANNINAGQFNYDDLVFVPNELVSEDQLISSGDIVITMSSGSKAHVGKVAIAKNDNRYTYGAFCAKITPNKVFPLYLYFALSDVSFRKHIETQCKGTNINNVKQSYILDFEIPLPPIYEQERIVARIEELFSQLDAGVETLKKTKAQLAVYRQAVLKEAFSKTTNHVLLGSISDSRLGKMLDKEKNVGIPRRYLRNINVRWFSFDLNDLLEMRIEENEVDKYTLHRGDLVICEGGEPGRCAVWENDNDIFYQKALHRVRFIDNSNPKFYMYYLWYAAQTGQLKQLFTGTGIKHLTGQSLVKVQVPTAKRDVQDRIVDEIESRLSVCDSIEKMVETTLQQAEAMRQSILKHAFEGGL